MDKLTRLNKAVDAKLKRLSSDLKCKHCGDSLGKPQENDNPAYCGNCGYETPNPKSKKLSSPSVPKSGDDLIIGSTRFLIKSVQGTTVVYGYDKGGRDQKTSVSKLKWDDRNGAWTL